MPSSNFLAGHAPRCNLCASFAEPLLHTQFNATWKQLPSACGLATWEDLRAQSEMDLGDDEEGEKQPDASTG